MNNPFSKLELTKAGVPVALAEHSYLEMMPLSLRTDQYSLNYKDGVAAPATDSYVLMADDREIGAETTTNPASPIGSLQWGVRKWTGLPITTSSGAC